MDRTFCDELNALSITMRDNYATESRGKPKPDLNPKFMGPNVILYDNWKSTGWDLLTHGGFVTYPHHNGAGFCTFVYPRSGSKIWGII